MTSSVEDYKLVNRVAIKKKIIYWLFLITVEEAGGKTILNLMFKFMTWVSFL